MAVALSGPAASGNPVGIRFGARALDTLPELIGDRSCLLLASDGQRRRGVVDAVAALIGSRLRATHCDVTPHPTVACVSETIRRLAAVRVDVVVAVGAAA